MEGTIQTRKDGVKTSKLILTENGYFYDSLHENLYQSDGKRISFTGENIDDGLDLMITEQTIVNKPTKYICRHKKCEIEQASNFKNNILLKKTRSYTSKLIKVLSYKKNNKKVTEIPNIYDIKDLLKRIDLILMDEKNYSYLCEYFLANTFKSLYEFTFYHGFESFVKDRLEDFELYKTHTLNSDNDKFIFPTFFANLIRLKPSEINIDDVCIRFFDANGMNVKTAPKVIKTVNADNPDKEAKKVFEYLDLIGYKQFSLNERSNEYRFNDPKTNKFVIAIQNIITKFDDLIKEMDETEFNNLMSLDEYQNLMVLNTFIKTKRYYYASEYDEIEYLFTDLIEFITDCNCLTLTVTPDELKMYEELIESDKVDVSEFDIFGYDADGDGDDDDDDERAFIETEYIIHLITYITSLENKYADSLKNDINEPSYNIKVSKNFDMEIHKFFDGLDLNDRIRKFFELQGLLIHRKFLVVRFLIHLKENSEPTLLAEFVHLPVGHQITILIGLHELFMSIDNMRKQNGESNKYNISNIQRLDLNLRF